MAIALRSYFVRLLAVGLIFVAAPLVSDECAILLNRYTNSTEVDFVREIANADSGPARRTIALIYADFLQDRGDPLSIARAEAIRLGVELEADGTDQSLFRAASRRWRRLRGLRRAAGWHLASGLFSPGGFDLDFSAGVPMAARHDTIGMSDPTMFASYSAERIYNQHLELWLKVPTLFHVNTWIGNRVSAIQAQALFGAIPYFDPVVIKAVVRGVSGALILYDQHESHYAQYADLMLQDILALFFRGEAERISALALDRLERVAEKDASIRGRLQMVRTLVGPLDTDLSLQKAAEALMETVLYPLEAHPMGELPARRYYYNLEDYVFTAPPAPDPFRVEDFFFFPSENAVVERFADEVVRKLELLLQNHPDATLSLEPWSRWGRLWMNATRPIAHHLMTACWARARTSHVLWLREEAARIFP